MKKREVLYIEDNFHNRRIVRKILERQGFQLSEAEDGLIGFNLLKEMKPPLVLLDISLPGMDGIEIAQRVKADPDLNHIFLIALTASAMQGDRERFLEAGCDDYMSKPFKALDLAQMVTEHFEAIESRQGFLESIESDVPETYVPAWEMPRQPADIDTVKPGDRQPEPAAQTPQAEEVQAPVWLESEEAAASQEEAAALQEETVAPQEEAAAETTIPAWLQEPADPLSQKEEPDAQLFGGVEDLETAKLDPAILAEESSAAALPTFEDEVPSTETLETAAVEESPPAAEEWHPAAEESLPAAEIAYPVFDETSPAAEVSQPAAEESLPAAEASSPEPIAPFGFEAQEAPSIEAAPIEEAAVFETDPPAIEPAPPSFEDKPRQWMTEAELLHEAQQTKPEEPEAATIPDEVFPSVAEEEVTPEEPFTPVEPLVEVVNQWDTAPVEQVAPTPSQPVSTDQGELEAEQLASAVEEPPQPTIAKIHTAPLDKAALKDNNSSSSADELDVTKLSRKERNKQITANILGMINPETIRPVDPNVGKDESHTR